MDVCECLLIRSHVLAGGGEGLSTFTVANITWPRDLLPGAISGSARVVSVEYLNAPTGALTPPMHVLQQLFFTALPRIGVGTLRPVVWIGHSMGGLHIKNLLVRAMLIANDTVSTSAHDREFARAMIRNTLGIIFLGTPHSCADPVTVVFKVRSALVAFFLLFQVPALIIIGRSTGWHDDWPCRLAHLASVIISAVSGYMWSLYIGAYHKMSCPTAVSISDILLMAAALSVVAGVHISVAKFSQHLRLRVVRELSVVCALVLPSVCSAVVIKSVGSCAVDAFAVPVVAMASVAFLTAGIVIPRRPAGHYNCDVPLTLLQTTWLLLFVQGTILVLAHSLNHVFWSFLFATIMWFYALCLLLCRPTLPPARPEPTSSASPAARLDNQLPAPALQAAESSPGSPSSLSSPSPSTSSPSSPASLAATEVKTTGASAPPTSTEGQLDDSAALPSSPALPVSPASDSKRAAPSSPPASTPVPAPLDVSFAHAILSPIHHRAKNTFMNPGMIEHVLVGAVLILLAIIAHFGAPSRSTWELSNPEVFSDLQTEFDKLQTRLRHVKQEIPMLSLREEIPTDSIPIVGHKLTFFIVPEKCQQWLERDGNPARDSTINLHTAVGKDHMTICKFSSNADSTFVQRLSFINDQISKPPTVRNITLFRA